jgi:type IV pilus assembly protein PilV
MNQSCAPQTRRVLQRGAMLIEGLVAITIFSFGILAVIGMMTTHMSTAADARYRIEASQFADSILADIRGSAAATRATDFGGPGGAGYDRWLGRIESAQLPRTGIDDNEQLEIAFAGADVTVTVRWRAPADRSDEPHQYVTVGSM